MSDEQMWADALSTFRCIAKARRNMPGIAVEDVLGEATADDIAREYAFLEQQALAAKRNQPATPTPTNTQSVTLRLTMDPHARDIFISNVCVGSFQWHHYRQPRIVFFGDTTIALDIFLVETIIKLGKDVMAKTP